jgi:phosphomannomutase/phosphoglucomutase
MKVNPNIFRGYDLRGLVGEDLTPELAFHLGKAFGTFLKRGGITEAVVARDCRATGPEYGEKIIEGLSWAGIDVVDIGMQLVGTFYWSQHYLKRRGGVYVSASHNPPEFNGFKFANDYSETLVSESIQELRKLVEAEDYEQGAEPGKISQQDIRRAYFDDILGRLPVNKKFKVVVDASCATAGDIAPDLLREAGCDVVEFNTKVDSSFPMGVADPTKEKIARRVSQEVLDSGADIGFTYDADGDRIGVVDEKGGIIWNDVLVAMFASDVLREHPGSKIMYNTLCSKVVEDSILAHGGTPFMWRTGHSFLKKKNQEVKAAFIGELSGHFFFSADFYNHDDGLYSTLRLLRYLAETDQKLSEAVAALPSYISSPSIGLGCSDNAKVELIAKLSPVLRKDFPTAEVIDDERAGDGLRLNLPDSMFVIRYSQNGPYVTIKLEAKTKEKYEELRKYILQLLQGYPEMEWDSYINVNIEALTEGN